MLAVPGWLDSHRLPKAVPVVSALKKIARVRLDASMSLDAGTPGDHVIDVERDADAEHQRHRDDVGEVQRQADQIGRLQGHDAGEHQRPERQQHVLQPPQRDPEDERDGDERTARPA